MKAALKIAAVAAAVAAAFAGGFWIRGSSDSESVAESTAATEKEVLYWYDPMYPDKRFDKPGPSPFMDMELVPKYAEEAPAEPEVLYWYDPMYPDKRFDKPGPSPFMDMDLVPKYAEGGGSGEGTVRIDPATVQNLGVRTAVVERGSLSTGVTVPGTLNWDQRQSYQVSARVGGVVERLHVRAAFEPVTKGMPLAQLIAPDWGSAIAEYRALAEARSEDARALRAAARERLRALGMDESQIRQIAGTGSASTVVVRSPATGVVGAIDVREGQQVAPGMPLMTVNGLDTVWAEAAIPQAQAGGITTGTPVEATVSAIPGTTFEGKVEALLPTVDPGTRTQTARIVLDNPEHRLAPGMFAELRFQGTAAEPVPLIPDDAIISTGNDARVIIAQGDGRFRAVRVRLGRAADGKTEVLSGLEGGEQIVVSGQFLIDSEASLSGALERLQSPPATTSPESDAGTTKEPGQ